MMKRLSPLTKMIVVLGLAVAATSQANAMHERISPQAMTPSKGPLGIHLLPGYTHTESGGIDSRRGRIAREGGPEIRYDIGDNSGNKARAYAQRHPEAWTITQTVPGGQAVITMDETQQLLLVTISGGANFEGHRVRTKRDVAEMLAMVLGFNSVM